MAIRVLVTGSSGFLLRNVLPNYDWQVIKYEYGHQYDNIDLVLHFGSPSDSVDFKNKSTMAVSMIDITSAIARQAVQNDCKMIFASSMAAKFLEDDYGIYKKAMEQYIQAMVDDHLILRIPRVYGKDRTKGLMGKILRSEIKEDEWSKEIQYIDIDAFKKWFDQILSKNDIQYFDGLMRCNTIKEIKELYCEF